MSSGEIAAKFCPMHADGVDASGRSPGLVQGQRAAQLCRKTGMSCSQARIQPATQPRLPSPENTSNTQL